jgi:predicted HTH domain antitoxin
MSVIISDEIISAAHMTEEEIKREIAVLLFQKEKITLNQASTLAYMNQIQFQHLLMSRGISIHYDSTDFEQDLKTLEQLKL